jgi:hypothetical protein
MANTTALQKKVKAMRLWEMVEIKPDKIDEYRSMSVPFSKQEEKARNGSLIITRTA